MIGAKKYLPGAAGYAILFSKHFFIFGMAMGAAYLSYTFRLSKISGKFMLLPLPIIMNKSRSFHSKIQKPDTPARTKGGVL